MKLQLPNDQKFILAVIGYAGIFIVLCVIIGAIFTNCENRKIEKHESNVNAAAVNIQAAENKVANAREETSEINGELKVRKEEKEKADVEVNQKTTVRREAAVNRDRVRRNPVRNVNGADLGRILDAADSNR